MRGHGAVELAVQSEPLGGVTDLHHAGDPAVVVHIAPDKVRSFCDDEIDVLLEAAYVFGL